MKLPNNENALISREKLIEYLLSETHPVGKAKARFFRSLGFNENNVDVFLNGLHSIAREGEVVQAIPSPYGVKYVVEGLLETISGGGIKIRTVWIVENDSDDPRFVTAYPQSEVGGGIRNG